MEPQREYFLDEVAALLIYLPMRVRLRAGFNGRYREAVELVA